MFIYKVIIVTITILGSAPLCFTHNTSNHQQQLNNPDFKVSESFVIHSNEFPKIKGTAVSISASKSTKYPQQLKTNEQHKYANYAIGITAACVTNILISLLE